MVEHTRSRSTPSSWRGEAAADWVWPLVEHNRAAIEHAASRFGTINWDYLYGCGAMGCVVPILPADGSEMVRYVAKVTTDEDEGGIVQRVLNTQAGPQGKSLDKVLDGLVRFEGVWRLPLPAGGIRVPIKVGRKATMSLKCAFLIIREEIEPLPESLDDTLWQAWGRDDEEGWFDALDIYQKAAKKSKWSKMAEELAIVAEYPEAAQLASAIQTLWAYDILLLDQHRGNLGFRIHSWPDGQEAYRVRWSDGVVRPPILSYDIGLSKDLAYPGSDPCKVVTRRVNPGLDADIARIVLLQ